MNVLNLYSISKLKAILEASASVVRYMEAKMFPGELFSSYNTKRIDSRVWLVYVESLFMPCILTISVPDPWYFGVDPDPRIHASALTNGSGSRFGSGSLYFHHWPSSSQQIINLKKILLISFLVFEGTFSVYHFSKINDQKKSQNKVFLTIFGWW